MNPNETLLLIGFTVAVVILILFAWRRINAPVRQIERYLKQLQAGERPELTERTDWDFEIALDPKGFAVVPLTGSDGSPIFVKWDAITDAIAFKRDLFSTDQVCIAFRLSDSSEFEVHEEMKGWSELCEAIPNHLPGSPPWTDWYMEITTPAFELNPTPLFRRDRTDSN